MSSAFTTVLVANRGEIARRVLRTLRRLGTRSVAVYSDADAGAPHVREADTAVRLGPAPAAQSYLRVDRIVAAALEAGADAVHPGYGFLSENVELARACAAAGIVFVGPGEHALTVMGDKIRARDHVAAHGVPIVRGASLHGVRDDDIPIVAAGVGYPLLVKPSAGGGGKGMEVVRDPGALAEAIATARRVARAAFGDDTLLLERLIERPRHIEVQVLADAHGAVVHLGERECTLQRRHQKVIEEAPSPAVDARVRALLGEAACAAAQSVGYVGAGTVEFLVPADDASDFSFIEMNTRLQVEHPVTELVTGLDLVEQQLRVAAGEPLAFAQDAVRLDGHAVEARVYAEAPHRGFLPATGDVLLWRAPAGARTDSGVETGSRVSADYDPMIAKVIAHAATRAEALARLDAALADTVLLGVESNLAFLRAVLAHPRVAAGELDTGLLAEIAVPQPDEPTPGMLARAALVSVAASSQLARPPWTTSPGWRAGATPRPTAPARFEVDGLDGEFVAGPVASASASAVGDGAGRIWVSDAGRTARVRPLSRRERTLRTVTGAGRADDGHGLSAPLPGTVVAVHVDDGARVAAGQKIATIEAMKMEHALSAPHDGAVRLHVGVGDALARDALVATVDAAPIPSERTP